MFLYWANSWAGSTYYVAAACEAAAAVCALGMLAGSEAARRVLMMLAFVSLILATCSLLILFVALPIVDMMFANSIFAATSAIVLALLCNQKLLPESGSPRTPRRSSQASTRASDDLIMVGVLLASSSCSCSPCTVRCSCSPKRSTARLDARYCRDSGAPLTRYSRLTHSGPCHSSTGVSLGAGNFRRQAGSRLLRDLRPVRFPLCYLPGDKMHTMFGSVATPPGYGAATGSAKIHSPVLRSEPRMYWLPSGWLCR